jgi:hypothetical protein
MSMNQKKYLYGFEKDIFLFFDELREYFFSFYSPHVFFTSLPASR